MTPEETPHKPLPLEGVCVLDFSRLLPAPWAAQMLGEFGADVIKVEQPGLGDPSRYNYPRLRKHSVYSNAVNANKRSITLDLSKPSGREIVQTLLRKADVIVESYRPGVARKLGIDYAMAKSLNPRIIYCSLSGFGQTGPLSHIAGHDLVIQGLTGLMGCALDAVNPPAVPGFMAADFAGALYVIIGVLTALAQRERTGEGCEIDVAMFDSLFNMCFAPLSSALARVAGHGGEPRMESFGGNPRYSTYLSKDGKPVAVSLLETKAWREFCADIGRAELVSKDESPADRLTAHGERQTLYRDTLARFCAEHSWAEIKERMDRTGIAVCPICTPDEAVHLPHVAARGLIGEIDHPVEGRIPHLVNPLAKAGLARGVHNPAPDLGAHTAEILREMGYPPEQISAFREDGVI